MHGSKMNGTRFLDQFAQYGPIARSLTQLIRPAFVAPEGKTLVWGDWSNIEARVNPWLSQSLGGERKLKLFRASDADPTLPDIYQTTAASLLGIDPHKVTKPQRQSHGKVPELALGFGGGMGALQAMATTYGVYIEERQGQEMIDNWRSENPWARGFWDALWAAAQNALEAPRVVFEAGRVSYMYRPDYLGGSLFCRLPDERMLTYPQCRWERKEVEDKDGNKELKWRLGYRKGHGRADLWYGKLCENVTQATAGSLLRAKLVRLERALERDRMHVVAHTHDDIVLEVEEGDEAAARDYLKTMMILPEPWSEGLPLKAATQSNWWLTKADD